MEIYEKLLDELTPYKNNPRNNAKAVDAVAASIKEFGFKQPVVIDRDGVIVAGHTRVLAAQKLGLKTVPCVIADDLTEEQVNAYRLADNKTNELAQWNFTLLDEELAKIGEIDMSLFHFDLPENLKASKWIEQRERYDNDGDAMEDEEYRQFVEKFEQKKTTDDCYTPDLVYEAVEGWVCKEYGLTKDQFCRPFYPGGNYQNYEYGDKIVVDNPPFSILSEILNWYDDHGIKFFLFAPALTLFSSSSSSSCAIACGVPITYENGAVVSTSFITNLEDPGLRVRTAPSLYQVVQEADAQIRKGQVQELPKYTYPNYVITAAMCSRWCKYGIDFRLPVCESTHIRSLDAQDEYGKTIFGAGYLLSERAAAERAAAERAAAERAAAHVWELSDREKEIVRRLSDGGAEVENKDQEAL